jgi:hypothetical protein
MGVPRQMLALILYAHIVRLHEQPMSDGDMEALISTAIAEYAVSESVQEDPESVRTRFGGLFYLLALVMELGIGEALWEACLPEQDILADCAAALLGSEAERDPSPALFGGIEPHSSVDVTAEQHDEVSTKLIANLIAALPRRGLAQLPGVSLRVHSSATGRALVASAQDSPFPIFVWPADDGREVAKGLNRFLSLWPASAPQLHGTAALAEVEGRVRIRSLPDPVPQAPLFMPETGSPRTAALINQIAGATGYLFAARVGANAISGAGSFVAQYLKIPAAVDRTPDEMRIVLPVSRIDIAVRRAGLDRDPGWIPWLKRTVRFVFEDA